MPGRETLCFTGTPAKCRELHIPESPLIRCGTGVVPRPELLHHSSRNTAPVIFPPGTEDYFTGTLSGLGRLYLEPTPERWTVARRVVEPGSARSARVANTSSQNASQTSGRRARVGTPPSQNAIGALLSGPSAA